MWCICIYIIFSNMFRPSSGWCFDTRIQVQPNVSQSLRFFRRSIKRLQGWRRVVWYRRRQVSKYSPVFSIFHPESGSTTSVCNLINFTRLHGVTHITMAAIIAGCCFNVAVTFTVQLDRHVRWPNVATAHHWPSGARVTVPVWQHGHTLSSSVSSVSTGTTLQAAVPRNRGSIGGVFSPESRDRLPGARSLLVNECPED